eukprot:Sdes_comp17535_c0_seq1m6779
MKLKLDALVIQQGRLQEQAKSLGKEEMLSMIRYGADHIFSSRDSTITDEDIDTILSHGEKKTLELSEKLTAAGVDELQSFSLDTGDYNVYSFEGEDYRKKQADNGILMNWIEPPKRERKINYNTDQYFRDALRANTDPKVPKAPRPPKQPNIADFQFYPARLLELLDKEIFFYRKSISYKAVLDREEGESFEEAESRRQLDQEKIDNAEGLTEAEIEEKEKLLKKGFQDWNRRDFVLFIKGCEKYGRDDYEKIAKDMDAKSVSEVREYSKVFFKRYKEVNDWERMLSNIEKGEAKLMRRIEIEDTLDQKVNRYRAPFQQLQIVYSNNRGKGFTEEEDRFLICTLHQVGYSHENAYEEIRKAIRNSPQFRFDWYFKSRSALELQRRCT